MARLARVVVPGHPHHVTQRGGPRARTFFFDADDALYRDLLAEHCGAADVDVWAWCLMPNHVHLILVPSDADGLLRTLAAVHRRYAGIIHARRKRTGHFWQGRFGAVVMDEPHLAAALRYVTLNPVRARLVERARDWRWSSTRAHLTGKTRAHPACAEPRAVASIPENPSDDPRVSLFSVKRRRRRGVSLARRRTSSKAAVKKSHRCVAGIADR